MSDVEEEKNDDPSPRRGLTLALTSGVFASLAGTFGKFAMTSSETVWMCEVLSEMYSGYLPSHNYMFCSEAAIYLQILAFIMMIAMNAVMWTTFVKALRNCKTSLEATVTNTAANFFSSALVGQLIFGESVSLLWWLGTLLIIFGLALMNYSQNGGSIHGGSFRAKKYKTR
ncbi:unnamed protein product [Allacma fusca]|uniref:EamA domain-containing protein n=1 Tax=Allacma fusca TaxID=39272 RepID=A0A8J2NGM7_9HEXA|nr:unnamed protein product [Allacma fusca]